MVRVGIIDSGVPMPTPDGLAEAGSFLYDRGQVQLHPDGARDRIGHGSAITGMINAAAPGLALYCARVFTDTLVTRPVQVAAALDWMLEFKVRIINLSFGLRADRMVLRTACARARRDGVILVAAVPARGGSVYPAAYPGVIRVCGDARCGPGELSFLGSPQADFGAHVRTDPGALAGASVATARVTAALVRLLVASPSLDRTAILAQLKASASHVGPEHRSLPRTSG